MKILHVMPSMNPADGGPVENIIRASAALANLGHENEVVSLDQPTDAWISDMRIPHHPLGPATRIYGYSPGFAGWVRCHVDDYDAVILHSVWNYSAAGAWRGLARTGKPYFVFAHGSLDPWSLRAQPIKGYLKQIYWALVLGRILAGARAVLFTAEEERSRARIAFRGYRYRERVVAFGTAQVNEDAGTQEAAFRAAVPELSGRRFLLLISRIHPKKGTDLLIRAFARCADQYPDHDLVIAGPDEIGWQTKLQRLGNQLGLKGRIHWPGWLSIEAKWGAFRAAEAFILPSHHENFGIVVAEAAACGTPILLTDKVNIWEPVLASGAGLVASDSQSGIEDLLRRFFALPPEQRERMGLAARRCFAENFDVTREAEDLIAVIESDAEGGEISR
jgi:glycosyltransferase involved in cell wall biosynthesis